MRVYLCMHEYTVKVQPHGMGFKMCIYTEREFSKPKLIWAT